MFIESYRWEWLIDSEGLQGVWGTKKILWKVEKKENLSCHCSFYRLNFCISKKKVHCGNRIDCPSTFQSNVKVRESNQFTLSIQTSGRTPPESGLTSIRQDFASRSGTYVTWTFLLSDDAHQERRLESQPLCKSSPGLNSSACASL